MCNQVNDLLVAFRLLTDGQEDASVWLKPTRSSQGVILVTSANELKYYDFPLGDVIMQENLWNNNEDAKSENQTQSDLQISPCVQYSGSSILEGGDEALLHSSFATLQARAHASLSNSAVPILCPFSGLNAFEPATPTRPLSECAASPLFRR